MPVLNGKVAIAGCRRTSDSDPSDLYPDPDATQLQSSLRSLGATATFVSWDDPQVEWHTFSHVLVSSTWDSVDRPREYLGWIGHVAGESTLVNPAAVIEWGLDKGHQRHLAAAGVPVIPTDWIAPGDGWAPPAVEFVVKPAVSAGGRSTARYHAGDTDALAHVGSLHLAGQTVMVQPYLSSIDVEGEVNIVLLGGEYSHAVQKRPVLTAGEGVVERPWERMSWDGLTTPSQRALEIATMAVAVLQDAVGVVPTYARVDLVRDAECAPRVLEVEVVDPNLSFDLAPTAADELAARLIRI